MEGSRRPLAVARVLQRQAQPYIGRRVGARDCGIPAWLQRRGVVRRDEQEPVAKVWGAAEAPLCRGGFVRLSLTETAENAPAWSIQALRVYGVR